MFTTGEIILHSVAFIGLFFSIFFIIVFLENKGNIKNPMPKRLPKVSILVPACNEEFSLAKTVESLLSLHYPKDKIEILIIDDGSVDRTLEIAKSFEKSDSRIRVFTKPNGGKGNALNFGLKHATGEIVGCLDADSIVDKDALMRMIGYFSDENVYAVTPSLKCTKPKTIWQHVQSIEFMMGVYLRKVFSFVGSIHVTPGPFTLYRKKLFDIYGGYDESTVTEDIEIALRIQSLGFEIENAVDASVYAVAMPTLKTLRAQRVRWYRGFLDNVMKYKHLFSRKYGNLGVFVLPAAFISIFTAFVAVTYLLYNFIYDNYHRLVNLYNVDFNIWKLKFFNADIFFFDQSSLLWIGLISFALGTLVIYMIIRISEKKAENYLFYSFMVFIILYIPLYTYWWGESIYQKMTKGEVVWRGRKRESKELRFS